MRERSAADCSISEPAETIPMTVPTPPARWATRCSGGSPKAACCEPGCAAPHRDAQYAMLAIPHWTGFLKPLATLAVFAMTSHSRTEAAPTDHETLDELLSPLLDRAYGFALRLLRNRADAEDLVQEGALAAIRGFGTFQPGTNFQAWFFRILVNCYYTRYRRQRHEGPTADLD